MNRGNEICTIMMEGRIWGVNFTLLIFSLKNIC